MLVGLYGAGQKLWLKGAIFRFLLECQMVLILFALSSYTNCLFFLILVECLGYGVMVDVQIATDCSVFDRFCF